MVSIALYVIKFHNSYAIVTINLVDAISLIWSMVLKRHFASLRISLFSCSFVQAHVSPAGGLLNRDVSQNLNWAYTHMMKFYLENGGRSSF